jgi:hypothetical protein
VSRSASRLMAGSAERLRTSESSGSARSRVARARVSFGEQQFGPIGQVRAGKFAEQLIDVADGFRMFFHAEHGRGHQQVGIVEEVGRGTAFDEASQHDRCGFRLFRVDQTFGLVEHGLAGGSRRFRLLCAGRRWILFGRGCLTERD